MRFDVALKKLGGHSVGGQLIVSHEGRNVLVGHHHDGQLIVADDPLAQRLVAAEDEDSPKNRRRRAAASEEPANGAEPAPGADGGTDHVLDVTDAVETADDPGGAG